MSPRFAGRQWKMADGFGPQPEDTPTPTPTPKAKPVRPVTPPVYKAPASRIYSGDANAGTITSQGTGISGSGGGWGIGTISR